MTAISDSNIIIGQVVAWCYPLMLALVLWVIKMDVWDMRRAFFSYDPSIRQRQKERKERKRKQQSAAAAAASTTAAVVSATDSSMANRLSNADQMVPRLNWTDVASLLVLWLRFVQMSSFAFVRQLEPDVPSFDSFYRTVDSVVHGFQGFFPWQQSVFWLTWAGSMGVVLVFFISGIAYNFSARFAKLRKFVLLFNWFASVTLFLPVLQVLLRTGLCTDGAFNRMECWGPGQIAIMVISYTALAAFVPFVSWVAPLVQIIPEVNKGSVIVKPAFTFLLVQSDIVLAIISSFFTSANSLVEVLSGLAVTVIQCGGSLWLGPVVPFPFVNTWRYTTYALQVWGYFCALLSIGLSSQSAVPFGLLLAGWAIGMAFLFLYHRCTDRGHTPNASSSSSTVALSTVNSKPAVSDSNDNGSSNAIHPVDSNGSSSVAPPPLPAYPVSHDPKLSTRDGSVSSTSVISVLDDQASPADGDDQDRDMPPRVLRAISAVWTPPDKVPGTQNPNMIIPPWSGAPTSAPTPDSTNADGSSAVRPNRRKISPRRAAGASAAVEKPGRIGFHSSHVVIGSSQISAAQPPRGAVPRVLRAISASSGPSDGDRDEPSVLNEGDEAADTDSEHGARSQRVPRVLVAISRSESPMTDDEQQSS